MKLSEIAKRLGSRLLGDGDGDIEITGVAGVEEAGAGDLTFLSNPRYTQLARRTAASAIIASKEFPDPPCPLLLSENPYLDFARALELFYQPPTPPPGVHPTAVVAASAEVGEGSSIGPYAVVGERVKIGRNVVLHPHVTLYEGARIGDAAILHSQVVVREYCVVGDRTILQNGVLIGTDGYGFAKRADGSHHKIPQSGVVILEEDVEIQAGSCVDRAAVGETRIRRGAKIDNLVQIGHAAEVGEDNIICSQVGIAGSTTLGKNCILAGQVGVINHLTIGDNVVITAQAGVGRNIPANSKISGSPSIDNRQWLRCTAVYNRLPELDNVVKWLVRERDRK